MRPEDEADRAQFDPAAGLMVIAMTIGRAPVEKVEQMLVKNVALAGLQLMAPQDQLENLATRRVDKRQLVRGGGLAGDDFSEREHG